MIYLDNSATTKVCPAAAEVAQNAMTVQFGNPSSLHRAGLDAENLMKASAKTIATALGCDPKELLFTSGATESNNLALLGAARANRRAGNKIITSAVEHPSVYETVRQLEKEGFEVVYIQPREDGYLHAEDFIDACDAQTILISCMLVNNETGDRMPIEAIARGARRKNPKVLIHSDAVQGFGKLPVSCTRLGVDLLSISGHKIYAPKGIGALYIRRGTKLAPLFYGGGQQNDLRVGTEPVPLIAAFGAAVEFCRTHMATHTRHYEALRNHLLARIADMPDVELNSKADGVPYIVNLSVKGLKSEILLHYLEQKEIYVSSGSACSRGKKSRVLGAFGLSDRRADTALRLSFAPDTTAEDLDALCTRITEGIASLAKLR